MEEHSPAPPPSHQQQQQGYQTNIIIDQHAQLRPVVEIVTSDLGSGAELGRTQWSGPDTLTLSSITAAVASNLYKHHHRQRKRNSPHPSSSSSGEVEVFS